MRWRERREKVWREGGKEGEGNEVEGSKEKEKNEVEGGREGREKE